MQVIFSDMGLESLDFLGTCVFLAGPTPRSASISSWRPEAIECFQRLGYSGNLLVPERRDWKTKFDYIDQVEWEDKGLNVANHILFWVPRSFYMPALTTNVEFGRWIEKKTGKITLGYPRGAFSMQYLEWLYNKETGRLAQTSLEKTIKETMRRLEICGLCSACGGRPVKCETCKEW